MALKNLLSLVAAVMLIALLAVGIAPGALAEKSRSSVLDLSKETTALENMPGEGWAWDPKTLTLSLSGFNGHGIRLPEGATVLTDGVNRAGKEGISAPSLRVRGSGTLICGSLKIGGALSVESGSLVCDGFADLGSLSAAEGLSLRIGYGAAPVAAAPKNKISADYLAAGLLSEVTAGEGISGAGSFISGETVTLSAQTAPDAWYVSNPVSVISGSQKLILTMPRGDVSVFALRASAQGGRVSFSVSGSSRVGVGAEPDEGYAFAGWTSSDVSFASKSSQNTSFAAPTKNVAVTAAFTRTAPEAVPLKFISGEGGRIENADASLLPGETTEIAAVPDAGYSFAGWKASAGSFADASAASTRFTVPEGGAEITASFEKTKYVLTVICSDPSAGSTSISTGSFYFLEKVPLSVTSAPDTSWSFVSWSAPEGVFSDPLSASTQFTMPAANVTVTANFVDKSEQNHISVTVSAGGKVILDGGTELTGSFSQERIAGSRVKLTAVPEDGYTFAGWLQSAATYRIPETPGETVPFKVSEDGMTLEYVMTVRSVSFSASFIASSRTLDLSASGEGSAVFSDPDPTVGSVFANNVSVGKTLLLTASPEPGFVFAGWEIDGLPAGIEAGSVIAQPNSPSTTLVMPNAQIKVTAVFVSDGSGSVPASTGSSPDASAPASVPIGSGAEPEPTEGAQESEGEDEAGISWPLLAAAAALAGLGVALVIRAEKRRRSGKVSLYRELFAKYNMKNLEKSEVKKLKERSGKANGKNGDSGGDEK